MTSRSSARPPASEAMQAQREADDPAYRPATDRGGIRDLPQRAMDVALAGAMLVATAPFVILVAALIRLDSQGPVLFRQQRVGRNMQPFQMLKFRTMRVGSDQVSPEVLNENGYGPLHKQNRDPRITRMGRVLRRLSLDEFPQLINVLRGEMSIVGPRPLLGWELEDHPRQQAQRTCVRPGITGLWQVNGRSDLSFEEMVRLDLEYVRRRSLWLDLEIIARTIPSVLSGRGAY